MEKESWGASIKKIGVQICIVLVCALIALAGNCVILSKNLGKFAIAETLAVIPGMLLLVALIALGMLAKRLIPIKALPTIAYVIVFGCIFTIPGFIPGAEWITEQVNQVNFMSLTTPVQAYIGLSLAKELPKMKQAGWRLAVLTVLVMFGTFAGSALISEVVLRVMGQV